MKILALSLDKSLLAEDSPASIRAKAYNDQAGLYESVVVTLMPSRTKIGQFFSGFKFISQKLKSEKFDLLTTQDPFFLGLLGMICARRYNLPLEVQFHGEEKITWLRFALAKLVLKHATSVRTVSQRLREILMNKYKVPAFKIAVFSVPLQVEVSTENKKLNSIPIIVTVGRLVPVKNIDLQIKVVKRLKESGQKVKLWIIGDGPEKSRLEQIVNKENLQQEVKFLGFQTNIGRFLNQADIFILTSSQEGWGVAVVEAAAYGLPIIMTNVGCAGELIKHQQSGLIIPVGDEVALNEAVKYLIDNKGEGRRLGQVAKQAILNLPNLNQTAEAMVDFWQKTIDNYNQAK